MEDMKVTTTDHDFGPRTLPCTVRRWEFCSACTSVRGARRSRFGGCELHRVGRQGSADTLAGRPHLPHLFQYEADHILCRAAAVRRRPLPAGRSDRAVHSALATRRVLRPGATSLDQTEPAVRPITIRHLMSYSSGLSYGLLDPRTLIFNAYNERKVNSPATTLAEMIDVLATCRWPIIPERHGSTRWPSMSWRVLSS